MISVTSMSAKQRARRASVHTLGCRLNQTETGLIVERLAEAGYTIVPFAEPADLGIINTCTVTGEADAKSRQLIRSFIRRNPDAYTAVVGCYSQIGHEALTKIRGIDLIVGNQEKLNVLEYVTDGKNASPLIVRDALDDEEFAIEAVGSAPLVRRANLKIQDGCDSLCSYCVVPSARGRARSRDLDNLAEEAELLAARGAREIVLTGVNLGLYSSKERRIVDVVDRLNGIPGIARIRISSIEPTTIPEALLERMDDSGHALVPHLHIPLQSGSNHVLALMNRRYTQEEFLGFVKLAHKRVRDICIGTDVMVGMPGESDADFEMTCHVVENGPIVYAHVFKYSGRPGTPASRHPGKVAPDAVRRRGAHMRRLSGAKRAVFHGKYVGQTMDVLFESEEDGYWFGYTGNYIRVAVRSQHIGKNTIRPVQLSKGRGDFMTGSLVDERSG